MARRNVRVTVNTKKPDVFSKLLNNIITYDNSLGADSVLQADPDIDMKAFGKAVAQADALRAQSESLRQQSEDVMLQAKKLYGTATGQSIDTEGTLYYTLDIIKKELLKKYKGTEETLSNYGFNIVITQSKSPTKKK